MRQAQHTEICGGDKRWSLIGRAPTHTHAQERADASHILNSDVSVFGGHVWRTCLADMFGGHVWRTCLADMFGGHVWRTCLADMFGGHVWRTCLADMFAILSSPSFGGGGGEGVTDGFPCSPNGALITVDVAVD